MLRGVFLFREWSDGDLGEIVPMAGVREFGKGDTVFRHGAECSHLYVVLGGRVQLSRIAADGRETVLNVLGPGELLACAVLFLDHAYPANARVVSAGARLLVLEGRGFLDMLRRRSDLSFRMIAALSVRISRLAGRIESRASESAGERVMSWLSEQADGGDGRVAIKSTKKALAEELGMTPETFSRVLGKLRDEGVIAMEGREIRVL